MERHSRKHRRLVSSIVVAVVAGVAMTAFAGKYPWYPRRRPGVRPNFAARARVKPDEWPVEPSAPKAIDAQKFADALRELCGWMPPERATEYSTWLQESAAEFDQDPFLLAGLMHFMSHCRPKKEELGGVGLTLIRPEMFHGTFKKGQLRYKVLRGNEWVETQFKGRSILVCRAPAFPSA